jgi:hypothetical protein
VWGDDGSAESKPGYIITDGITTGFVAAHQVVSGDGEVQHLRIVPTARA